MYKLVIIILLLPLLLTCESKPTEPIVLEFQNPISEPLQVIHGYEFEYAFKLKSTYPSDELLWRVISKDSLDYWQYEINNHGVFKFSTSYADTNRSYYFKVIVNYKGVEYSNEFTIEVSSGDYSIILNCPDSIVIVSSINKWYYSFMTNDSLNLTNTDWTIHIISPEPVGKYSISKKGFFTFTAAMEDGGKTFIIEIRYWKTSHLSSNCQFILQVEQFEPFEIKIPIIDNALLGQIIEVPIYLTAGSEDISLFTFNIGFDDNILSFESVERGDLINENGCDWGVLVKGLHQIDSCDACLPSYLLFAGYPSFSGIPDCNIGLGELAILKFRVIENQSNFCTYTPIKFIWGNCSDNIIVSNEIPKAFYSRNLYSGSSNINIAEDSCSSINYDEGGACIKCDSVRIHNRYNNIRAIDFWNGGINIVCPDSIGVEKRSLQKTQQ